MGKSVELLYCARSRSEAAFVDQLAADGRAQTHFDQEAGGPPDLRGYLAGKSPAAHFYCCGPTPMLNAFESICAELKLPHVHIERFAPAEPVVAMQGSEYECQLARSQKMVMVPAGKSLLDALLEAGVAAAFLNSSLSSEDAQRVEKEMLRGELTLLYAAPERLTTPRFLALLDSLKERGKLALFAIDEAHCVSQWGHDFRPEYRALAVLHERFPGVP
eukprot:gene34256-56996_t